MKRAALYSVTTTALAVTLFWSYSTIAHHKPGHNPPGQSKKLQRGSMSDQGMVKRGGPPPWAPAHGYRGKRVKYQSEGRERIAEVDDLIRIPSTGTGFCNGQRLGEVLGGIAGGAAGSQIGKGDGRTLATLTGTIVGVLVGGAIGRSLDEIDQKCLGQSLERAATGQRVVWRNTDRQGEYQVIPTRTYRRGSGQFCRDYQMKVIIAGRTENAVGSACRQPDGTWKRSG